MTAARTCRTCRSAIVWAINDTTGRLMPLDALPVDDGNVILTGRERAHTSGEVFPECHVFGSHPTFGDHEFNPDAPRRKSHFATCPEADAHRRTKGGLR